MVPSDTLPAKAFRPAPLAPQPPLSGTAAMIGPEGGTLQVSDPDSPIRGTSLHIPPGALETYTLIQIEAGAHPCSFGLAPSVKLGPEGLRFKHPVEIRVPIQDGHPKDPNIPVSCYAYSESDDEWLPRQDSPAAADNGIARCRLRHL